MKKLMLGLAVVLAISACRDSSKKTSNETKTGTDTVAVKPVDTTTLKEIKPGFENVNAAVMESVNKMVDHYLHIKNALVADKGGEAAEGGKEFVKAMSGLDKALLTAEQKLVFAAVEDDLLEHAEHIGSNGNHIDHQREHFAMMSEDMYDIIKAFGSNRPLYHDHCPMANDNKGALWLSETREIHNPYFAGKMNECVKVVEVIK